MPKRTADFRPGMAVVELTSGNMGIGLAVACAIMGDRMIAVMSEGNSPERRQLLAAYGAEIELVPQAPGGMPGKVSGEDLALVEARTAELVEELGAWRPDQFANPSNPRAHELGTGPELWEQAGGRLGAFVAIVGTGGTFVGIARALKARDSAIRCLAVEPAGAQALAGQAIDVGCAQAAGRWLRDDPAAVGRGPLRRDDPDRRTMRRSPSRATWRGAKASSPGSRPGRTSRRRCDWPQRRNRDLASPRSPATPARAI